LHKNIRQRHKETATVVGSGLVINYPLQIVFLYWLIDVLKIVDPFWVATYSTMFMTVAAYVRVFIVRSIYDKKK